jgi:hypothetical protein
MASQPRQHQCLLVWFFVDEQQIWLDVAFPVTNPSAFQRMIMGGFGNGWSLAMWSR